MNKTSLKGEFKMDLANLRERTFEYLNKSGVSKNNFAKQLGINVSYLSQFLNDESDEFKYAGKVAEKLANFLDNLIEKKEKCSLELPFIETKDARSIAGVINFAVEDRDMAVIIGEAGTGKTRAIKHFVSKHPEAILIEATTNTNSRTLFTMLAAKLRIAPSKSIDETIRKCAQALAKADKIIIIDESEHLPYKTLEGVRRLYDFSQNPLILVGTRKLYYNLTGAKNKNLEYEQLSSRVGSKWELVGLSNKQNNDDLAAVCGYFGVKNKELIKIVESIARGNFRKTQKLLSRSAKLADLNECDINEEILKEATSMLLL